MVPSVPQCPGQLPQTETVQYRVPVVPMLIANSLPVPSAQCRQLHVVHSYSVSKAYFNSVSPSSLPEFLQDFWPGAFPVCVPFSFGDSALCPLYPSCQGVAAASHWSPFYLVPPF